MKRVIISALIIAVSIIVHAQELVTPLLNYKVLEKKFIKSSEDITNEKRKYKPSTWFNRGALLQDIHDVNTEFIRLGLLASEAKLYLGEPNEIETNNQGQELQIYDRITLIYEEGIVVDWKETQQIHKDPLPIALEAYCETLKLDEKGKFDEKVLNNLDRLKLQAETDAINHFRKQEFNKALEKFQLIIKTNETPVYEGYIDSLVIFNSALAAKNGGMHIHAARYFEWATQINYGGSDVYFLLMREYIALQDSTKALSALQRGFRAYPDSTLILFELINYYVASGDFEEGMNYVSLALDKDSTNPSLYFIKGILHERLGEREKAKEEYLNSLELNPNFYNSWYNLSALHFNMAVEMYELANTMEDLEEYNKAVADADEEMRRALEPMEKAHLLNPEESDPLETLKSIYYRLKLTEKYEEVSTKLKNM